MVYVSVYGLSKCQPSDIELISPHKIPKQMIKQNHAVLLLIGDLTVSKSIIDRMRSRRSVAKVS